MVGARTGTLGDYYFTCAHSVNNLIWNSSSLGRLLGIHVSDRIRTLFSSLADIRYSVLTSFVQWNIDHA